MNTLAHLTLNTGHVRMSPRSEVMEDAIRVLDPIVRSGKGRCPMPGVTVEMSIHREPGLASIDIGDGQGHSAIIGLLAWEADKDEALCNFVASCASFVTRKNMAALPKIETPSHLPWLAVFLSPVITQMRPDLVAAFADLERCVAWTILAQEGLAS